MECLNLRAVLALSGVILSASTVAAQVTGGWIIELSDTVVTPDRPTVTVRVLADFQGFSVSAAFHNGVLDLLSSDDRGTFTGMQIPPPLGPLPPGSHGCFGLLGGTPQAGSIFGVLFFQIDIIGCSAHRARPLPIWEAVWTTDEFTSRSVQFSTATTPFYRVYVNYLGDMRDLVFEGLFQHASAIIQVRPSECFADCDTSTGVGALDIFDFLCFMNLYAEGDPIACDCDTATGPGVCDIFDFLCFQSRFVAGCP